MWSFHSNLMWRCKFIFFDILQKHVLALVLLHSPDFQLALTYKQYFAFLFMNCGLFCWQLIVEMKYCWKCVMDLRTFIRLSSNVQFIVFKASETSFCFINYRLHFAFLLERRWNYIHFIFYSCFDNNVEVSNYKIPFQDVLTK